MAFWRVSGRLRGEFMYKHTQIGWGIVIIFGLLALLAYFKILGNDSAEGIVYGILLLVMILFAKLTVTVDNQYIRLHFGLFGLPRRKFKLQDIKSCRPVKNIMFAISLGIHYGRTLRYTMSPVPGRWS